jgi:hypothetical protein
MGFPVREDIFDKPRMPLIRQRKWWGQIAVMPGAADGFGMAPEEVCQAAVLELAIREQAKREHVAPEKSMRQRTRAAAAVD